MVRPVILCGGSGTRLWPLSTSQHPKQFLPLMSERSLLQETAERLTGDGFAPAIVVSSEEQSSLVNCQLADANASVSAILLEPAGRNTAAAAALAAQWLKSTGRDELLLLVPSDHVIGDREAFVQAVQLGVPQAESGAIVTFGARPTGPKTQYGYIEAAPDGVIGDGAYRIARFHEKPNAERAAEYLASGRFFWNCGIFLAKGSTILEEMHKHLPKTAVLISAAVANGRTDGLFFRPSPASFSQAENISIDNGVMEKTSRGVVVPVQMQWSDVGAWDAVWELGSKDADGNVIAGDVVTLDCHNSLLRADGPAIIAAMGLENIAVIAVDDAIFVAPIDRVAEMKELHARATRAKAASAKSQPSRGSSKP